MSPCLVQGRLAILTFLSVRSFARDPSHSLRLYAFTFKNGATADDDGSAYHVRTGLTVVRLNDNFTGPQEHVCDLSTPRKTEAPVLFKRRGKYYVLAGACCCICTGGSNIIVMMADSIRGPWTFAGDVGSNPTHFDRHSPNNCERHLPRAMIGTPLWNYFAIGCCRCHQGTGLCGV